MISVRTLLLLTKLRAIRHLVERAADELRPDTEYLREEFHKLLELVDNLWIKVENDELLQRDKEQLQ